MATEFEKDFEDWSTEMEQAMRLMSPQVAKQTMEATAKMAREALKEEAWALMKGSR